MANKLIIHIYEHSNELVDWALVDSTGKILQAETSYPIADLNSSMQENDIIALVPGALIASAALPIPKTARSKLMQAIPFAIEQQTIEKTRDLHFAIGDRNDDDTLNVAYLSDAEMKNWLKILKHLQKNLVAVYPDNQVLPCTKEEWLLFVEDKVAIVCTGKQAGFSIETDDLVEVLKLMLKEEKGKRVVAYNIDKNSRLGEEINTLTTIVEFKQVESYFELISEALIEPKAINLLQNRHKVKSKLFRLGYYWGWAAKLAIIWVAVLFLGNLALLGYLKFQHHRTRSQIISLYQQVFPNATTIEDPQAKITAEMEKYSSATKRAGFIYLLGQAGEVFRTKSEIKLQKLSFRNNRLQVEVTAANFAGLDSFVKALSDKALQVKQDKAYAKGNIVVAEITIGTRG